MGCSPWKHWEPGKTGKHHQVHQDRLRDSESQLLRLSRKDFVGSRRKALRPGVSVSSKFHGALAAPRSCQHWLESDIWKGWTADLWLDGGEMLRLSFWSHGFLARTEYSSHMDRGQLAFYSPLCPSPERRQEPAGDTTLPSLAPQDSPSHLCLTRLPSLGLGRKRQRWAGEPGQCLRRSAASLGAHLPPGAGSASALAKGSCGCAPCTGCTLTMPGWSLLGPRLGGRVPLWVSGHWHCPPESSPVLCQHTSELDTSSTEP